MLRLYPVPEPQGGSMWTPLPQSRKEARELSSACVLYCSYSGSPVILSSCRRLIPTGSNICSRCLQWHKTAFPKRLHFFNPNMFLCENGNADWGCAQPCRRNFQCTHRFLFCEGQLHAIAVSLTCWPGPLQRFGFWFVGGLCFVIGLSLHLWGNSGQVILFFSGHRAFAALNVLLHGSYFHIIGQRWVF